jgi:hypothetical protein
MMEIDTRAKSVRKQSKLLLLMLMRVYQDWRKKCKIKDHEERLLAGMMFLVKSVETIKVNYEHYCMGERSSLCHEIINTVKTQGLV